MTTKQQLRGKGPQCHYCKKYGHIQKNCFERIKAEETAKQGGSENVRRKKSKANKVELVTCHVLGVNESAHDWIVEAGATGHICNSKMLFEDFHSPQKLTLVDGHTLPAIGRGAVEVKLNLPRGESNIGRLSDVLYMPTLAYNLLSVAKVTEAGKTVTFGETQGEVIYSQREVVAVVLKTGSLYYLNYEPLHNLRIKSASLQTKENLWYWRISHLGERSLSMLKRNGLVNGFVYDISKELTFASRV